jgi:hypothetical protein
MDGKIWREKKDVIYLITIIRKKKMSIKKQTTIEGLLSLIEIVKLSGKINKFKIIEHEDGFSFDLHFSNEEEDVYWKKLTACTCKPEGYEYCDFCLAKMGKFGKYVKQPSFKIGG